jgi:RNA polymerase sigma factor (sigma-70 family)
MERVKKSVPKKKKKRKRATAEEEGEWPSLRRSSQQENGETGIDPQAANRLIREYEPFIKSIAGKFSYGPVPFNELLQCGREGFYQALIRYRGEYGTRLITYAYQWVRGAMTQRIRLRMREQRELVQKEGDLGEHLEHYLPRSTETNLFFTRPPNQETIVLFRELADTLQKRLYQLTERQRLVLCRVTGFRDRKGPQTMEELAKQFHVSKEAIHDSKMQALRRLRINEARLTEIAAAEELMQAYLD